MRLSQLAALALLLAPVPAQALKMTRYPELKVEVAPAFSGEAGIETLRAALADAVAKKDSAALFALVGPTFLWTVQQQTSDEFDLGRDAQHNFRVAFGFREVGKDADGPVEGGPYWETLGEIVKNTAVDRPSEGANLVCLPLQAAAADEAAFEKAQKAIETEDDAAAWFYTVAETPVAKAPGDTGPPIAKLGQVIVPVTDVHPPAPEGQTPPPATHYQVLLPTGKTGWVPVAAVKPLVSDRLCFAKTGAGDWKIASFDQNQ